MSYSFRFTDDPVHDAELYAIERSSHVVGRCAACDREIYGRSRSFDSETYILDDDGNMIHPTRKCLQDVLAEKIFDWFIDEYEKKDIVDGLLDSMERPEEWLLEKCEEEGWVNG